MRFGTLLGERFPLADFAICGFVLLTNRKLLGMKVTFV